LPGRHCSRSWLGRSGNPPPQWPDAPVLVDLLAGSRTFG
jgi:hypothetical protein